MKEDLHGQLMHLLTIGSAKILIDQAACLLQAHTELVEHCFSLVNEAHSPVNWRAAWVLSVYFDAPEVEVSPYIHQVVSALTSKQKAGIRRAMLHILIPNVQYLGIHTGVVLESAYSILFDTSSSIAERGYSMHLLNLITQHVPDLREEYILTLHMLSQQTEGSMRKLIHKILNNRNQLKYNQN